MTFTEAAAQVLRLIGKPLHYKEITDVAIEKNLLSHVGKSPEVTMGARLAALVKKAEKDNPLVRVKPGVFALRDWDQRTIDVGLADRTPALTRLKELEARGELPAIEFAPVAADETVEEEGAPSPAPAAVEADREREELAAQASELFAAEEDDDEPIFGSDEPAKAQDGAAADSGDGSRRRRRRRRRNRGDDAGSDADGDDLPSYTVSDAPALDGPGAALESEPGLESSEPIEVRASGGQSGRERDGRGDRQRGDREPRGDRGDRGGEARGDRGGEARGDRGERGGEARGDRGERERGDRDRADRDRAERDRGERGSDVRQDAAKGAIDELAGSELADAVAPVLGSFDRSQLVPLARLAETIKSRGRSTLDMSQLQALLGTALRADNLRREAAGERPRFRITGGKVGLVEWQLDGELARLERELVTLAERHRDATRRLLQRKLGELPARAFGEVALLLLQRLGFQGLATLRRPGAAGAELHLSGRLVEYGTEQRVAIVVRRDGREVGRERVSELRGSLHHYGPAHSGWLITSGQVLSGAREEAGSPGAAPVTLVDGGRLARLCEEHGVGVVNQSLKLTQLDLDLLDGLRGA